MSEIKINTINLKTANKLTEIFYNNRVPLFLWGKPSTAKTSSMRQFAIKKAAELNLEYSEEYFGEKFFTFKTITLSQMDSPDLRGMPVISVDKNGQEVTRFIPTEELPRTKGARGILFFDELNNGDETTVKASYQIILEGSYGNLPCLKIEDKNDPDFGKDAFWRVAASNTEDDFCNTTPMPLALLRRFSHVEVMPTSEEVINYFIDQEEDVRVIAYLQTYNNDLFPVEWNEKLLIKKSNPFPSQWQRISKMINGLSEKNDSSLINEIVSSCVGSGIASKFLAFIKVANKINWDEIYTNTKQEVIRLQKDPEEKISLMYSLLADLAVRWKNNTPIKVAGKTVKMNDNIIMDTILNIEKEMQIAFIKILKQSNSTKFFKFATDNDKLQKEVLQVIGELLDL